MMRHLAMAHYLIGPASIIYRTSFSGTWSFPSLTGTSPSAEIYAMGAIPRPPPPSSGFPG